MEHSALSLDVAQALQQLAQLKETQRVRGDFLDGERPEVPLHAFGQGLSGLAKQWAASLARGHDVGVEHARRVHTVTSESEAVVRRVDAADTLDGGGAS
ncbi:hypothetical protein GC425_04020 [Corynebacterium sp. zg254]|uniref:Uncharacterized protein n=1 Tax=Corynebacterium zhongnanshanii TaxID=2768834 RepID=A0ABQ6VEP4_9CORY|nr:MULTISPECIES: hypothetical protein [Corynebacterium]KAB3522892.1 hypothetical protein F8377_01600 [Corynebacterium zhongnanshanii]MCR5914037.1 hypothetical protein [Corynebacterium sp. zg254]